jgi:hypothetical protein
VVPVFAAPHDRPLPFASAITIADVPAGGTASSVTSMRCHERRDIVARYSAFLTFGATNGAAFAASAVTLTTVFPSSSSSSAAPLAAPSRYTARPGA